MCARLKSITNRNTFLMCDFVLSLCSCRFIFRFADRTINKTKKVENAHTTEKLLLLLNQHKGGVHGGFLCILVFT